MSKHYNFDFFANAKQKYFTDSELDYYNPHSGHALGALSYTNMSRSIDTIKALFSKHHTIEFVPGGGSLANKRAIFGSTKIKLNVKPDGKNIILISSIEHSSISKYMMNDFTDRGYTIIIIPVTEDGTINMKLYEKLVMENKDRIVLVSCMLVNNEIGTIQPINEMIQFLKLECPDAIFHSDVGGSIGLFHKLYNDFVMVPDIVTCSCYKFHGPHYGLLLSNCIMRQEYYGTPDVRNICEIQMALSDHIEKYNSLQIIILLKIEYI